MKMSSKLMKRTLGCLLALTTMSMSVPADAKAGSTALPNAVDELGDMVELTGVDDDGDGGYNSIKYQNNGWKSILWFSAKDYRSRRTGDFTCRYL